MENNKIIRTNRRVLATLTVGFVMIFTSVASAQLITNNYGQNQNHQEGHEDHEGHEGHQGHRMYQMNQKSMMNNQAN